MLLANAFGGIALFLASLGIYGVLAYLVAPAHSRNWYSCRACQHPAGILKLVLRRVPIVAIECFWELSAPYPCKKLWPAKFYGVRPLDPLVLASVHGLASVIALAACAVPCASRNARRTHSRIEI